ncbi:hypothetical protein [Hymenobacter lapidiphilus]|uniref:Uncharacterized protein n=1 Tax=Hymenobacter lapidiphilus TaxID=2608003 RepID=A0A7Y7PMC2_9BACT|nr:hypothetical protein [Hymenobacter lapidiphilus]NVO30476.1 hypothetical protein [Hymenobacter lapidiphilus]
MPPWFIGFAKLLDFVAYTSLLLPFYLAHTRRTHLTGGLLALRFLPIFLFGTYCLMHVANTIWRNNIPLIHFATIVETLIYLKVYHNEFIETNIKKTIRYVAVAFLFFAFIDSVWLESPPRINSYTNLVESIMIIGLALLFFEKIIVRDKQPKLLRTPMFVATVGIVIYLSGTVLLFLTTNYFIVLNDEFNLRLIYLVSSVLLLLLAVLLSRAFLLVRPTETPLR